MDPFVEHIPYVDLQGQPTGGPQISGDYKILICPFDRFNIKMILGSSNEFIGIAEVQINKDFLSHKQKMQLGGYHDVEQFYLED